MFIYTYVMQAPTSSQMLHVAVEHVIKHWPAHENSNSEYFWETTFDILKDLPVSGIDPRRQND